MKKKYLCTIILVAAAAAQLQAQSDDFGVWTSAEVKKKITNRLDGTVEGELRTQDGLRTIERWTVSPTLSYRLLPYLKADIGYSYIHKQVEARTTKKGNYIPAYWSPRHRFTASLIGSYTWNRLEFSLRERYQYTYRESLSVAKYDGDDGSQKANEEIEATAKNVLRSRLQVAWKIRKSPLTPYASYELYNNITEGWTAEKNRWTIGTEWKINKAHLLDVFYRYQAKADDDEANGHIIGVGYKFKFKKMKKL